jgi:hypothetical protein
VHPSTESILRYFTYDHLPVGPLRDTSKMFYDMAHHLVDYLEGPFEGPELTTGLRKLLEAKDCFARAALDIVK